jgi:hypothetical protein
MKPTAVAQALTVLASADQPVMLWGGPGGGKTSLVRQFAARTKRAYVELRATLIDPADLRWTVRTVDGKLIFSAPEFLPTEENSVLNIDDLPTAPPLVQAALYQLVLDRKLGEYNLPKGTIVFATGNRETDRAAVSKMPTPLANRFTHIELEIDTKDWIDWAIESDLAIEVIAGIRFSAKWLCNFNPLSAEKAQATPRTWEFVSKIIKANPPQEILLDLISGTVGKAIGTEFMGFMEDWKDLPDPMEIMKNPGKVEIPRKPSVLFAVCQTLAKIVDKKTADNFFTYAFRMVDGGLAEFAVAMVHDATKRSECIKETAGYIKWIAKMGKLYAS